MLAAEERPAGIDHGAVEADHGRALLAIHLVLALVEAEGGAVLVITNHPRAEHVTAGALRELRTDYLDQRLQLLRAQLRLPRSPPVGRQYSGPPRRGSDVATVPPRARRRHAVTGPRPYNGRRHAPRRTGGAVGEVTANRKATAGNYFEHFASGREFTHAVPRTLTEGDCALYIALTADRHPLHCDAEFARSLGFERETVNDLLVFHTVFGKTVPDLSLNAIANLGYADARFGVPVYPGDTLSARSTVLGRRESTRGDTGVVWVRTVGRNQRGDEVLSYIRWFLVAKLDPATPAVADDAPQTPAAVAPAQLVVPAQLDLSRFAPLVTGGRAWWADYAPGERIHHVEGMAVEEAEHQMAARLYQNVARAHFNAYALKDSRFGRRVVYGGHVISIARALAFNGCEHALRVLAVNGGTHSNPTFAGDTLFAWTDVLERIELGRDDAGALRLRLVATKNRDPATEETPLMETDAGGRERYHPSVVLDLDYTVLMPKAPR
ncbi:MAG: MaoC family dehydratase [Dehalococcoidia bacterium]|nr:MaoC family dehydratase [Dehalococcoidia bacterium]